MILKNISQSRMDDPASSTGKLGTILVDVRGITMPLVTLLYNTLYRTVLLSRLQHCLPRHKPCWTTIEVLRKSISDGHIRRGGSPYSCQRAHVMVSEIRIDAHTMSLMMRNTISNSVADPCEGCDTFCRCCFCIQ